MQVEKVYIKLVSVTHKEWFPYLEEFRNLHNCQVFWDKDTYWCLTNQEGYEKLEQIQRFFELQSKTIIIKKGDL